MGTLDIEARTNRNLIEDAGLEEFLFGTRRISLEKLRPGLKEIQRGSCFYCRRRARESEIDHFVPWSRYADNGLDNLVVACRACNNAKRNSLAAGPHLEKWCDRFNAGNDLAAELAGLAEAVGWERHPDRTLGVARAIYLRLPEDVLLWGPESSVSVFADLRRIRDALAA